MSIDSILQVVLSVVAVFLAIVLHEIAHGYVAWRLGDPTARSRGRLTLNPLAHVDPIGTVLIPLTLAVLRYALNWGVPLFGWAKPVPINPSYFRNPLRGMLYVAIAGPGTNLALALVSAGIFRGLLAVVPATAIGEAAGFSGYMLEWLFFLLAAFVIYNLVFCFLNLIPIPPLDGSRILLYFLPAHWRRGLLSIERYGLFIMLGLIYVGGLSFVFRGAQRLSSLLLGI